MSKWKLHLHNPCYREKTFDLEFEGESLDDIVKLLVSAAEKMNALTDALDRSER